LAVSLSNKADRV